MHQVRDLLFLCKVLELLSLLHVSRKLQYPGPFISLLLFCVRLNFVFLLCSFLAAFWYSVDFLLLLRVLESRHWLDLSIVSRLRAAN